MKGIFLPHREVPIHWTDTNQFSWLQHKLILLILVR